MEFVPQRIMKNSSATLPISGSETTLDEIKERILAAYPTASDQMVSSAIVACQKELDGSTDAGRLIRCVCERITA